MKKKDKFNFVEDEAKLDVENEDTTEDKELVKDDIANVEENDIENTEEDAIEIENDYVEKTEVDEDLEKIKKEDTRKKVKLYDETSEKETDIDDDEDDDESNTFPESETINESLTYVANTNSMNNKLYVSFEMRIAAMVLIIIVTFGIACASLIEAFTHNESEIVTYTENSQADYKVCLTENSDYSESCLNENMEYLSLITKNIPITFNYNVSFSKNIEYDLDYYVTGTLRIVDNGEENRVLYTSNDVLIPNTKLNNNSDIISFSSVVDVDFKKYNDYVISYKSRYSLNSNAYLDVVLYLNEDSGARKISTVTIPLGEQTYNVTKDLTNNANKQVVVKNKKWSQYNIIFAIIGAIFILIGLLVLIKLTSLIIKIANNTSKYQQKLNQILREFDRIIVTAKDGYTLDDNKKLIKVSTFEELLDARDTLEKPIIYVKVNQVKSEFYVEDNDKVYRYIMKEADF